MLGHDGPPTYYYRENLVSNEPLLECPLRTILRATDRDPALVREINRHGDEYFPSYQAGYLLAGGGIGDQPALYLDYMNALTDLRARQQRECEKTLTANEPSPKHEER